MPSPDRFTPAETRALEVEARDGSATKCPHCAIPMDQQAVPPRQDVSYVRDRILLVCPECRRTHVLDRVLKG